MKVIQLCVGMVATNCYIVFDEATHEAAVIDPGDDATSILRAIADEKLAVKYVLLTHAHFDHILAAHEVLQSTGAVYVVPDEDVWLLDHDNMGPFRGMVHQYVKDEPNILAKEGTTVTFGGLTAEYLRTPGHTPGSSVIRIDDVLFTGDTLFRHECGRCDLEGGSFREMLKSLKRLYHLPGDYKVLPGHDAVSTLAEERQYNPYMRQAISE